MNLHRGQPALFAPERIPRQCLISESGQHLPYRAKDGAIRCAFCAHEFPDSALAGPGTAADPAGSVAPAGVDEADDHDLIRLGSDFG